MKQPSSAHGDEPAKSEDKTQIKVAVITSIVTIIVAIITVVGGPLLTRYLDGQTTAPATEAALSLSSAEQGSGNAASQDIGGLPAYKPMRESNAVITALDGTQTTVQASTLCWCTCAGTHSVDLLSGSSILLDRVKRIEVVEAEPAGGNTLFAITLLDNSSMQGEALTCAFTAETAAGRFEISTDQVQSVEIIRN